MRRLLVLSTAMTTLGFAASAADITVLGWGGAYTQSQIEAYHKLFTAETVWWEVGAQKPQLLSDGEVAMTVAWNGRIFNASVAAP